MEVKGDYQPTGNSIVASGPGVIRLSALYRKLRVTMGVNCSINKLPHPIPAMPGARILMAYKTITMELNKKIALVAHDNKKRDLVEWSKFNRDLLAHHKVYATGTTGILLERELGFSITKLQSGPLGGDQQIGAKIVDNEIDFLIFFWDPLEQQAHDPDIKALLRMAVVWNIPIACDRASADFIISSPLMDKTYDRLIPDYDIYRNRKVAGVETPPLPIPGVTDTKKRRVGTTTTPPM